MKVGSGRIVVMVALVAGGIILLATGFSRSPGVASASRSHSPSSPTGSHSSPTSSATPTPHTTGLAIAVFNATSVANLATKGQRVLVSAGYVPAQQPQNSPIKSAVTVIYYRPGPKAAQNRSDAQYIADKYFPGASVSELGSAFIHLAKGADVVVVLGDDYANTK